MVTQFHLILNILVKMSTNSGSVNKDMGWYGDRVVGVTNCSVLQPTKLIVTDHLPPAWFSLKYNLDNSSNMHTFNMLSSLMHGSILKHLSHINSFLVDSFLAFHVSTTITDLGHKSNNHQLCFIYSNLSIFSPLMAREDSLPLAFNFFCFFVFGSYEPQIFN